MSAATDTYTLRQVARRLGVPLAADSPDADLPLQHYLYDTRLAAEPAATVFLALPGEHRHGMQYVAAAYAAGIRAFWLPQPADLPADAAQLVMPDVLAALQVHAAAHRAQFGIPVVGITGSNGKTTVKEWLATALEAAYEVHKSPGSFNSQLGVALSLLGLRRRHTLALIEAGISRSGEMAALAQMVRPTHGILTHMGDAHAEGFTDFEAKLREKLLLFASAATVFTGPQPPAAAAVLHAVLPHAVHVPANARPDDDPAAAENRALVLAVARHFGVADVPAERLQPVSMRTELVTDNPELSILNDAYNADADSVRNAFTLLAAQRFHPHRRVVLTDLEHQGRQAEAVQHALVQLAVARFGAAQVELVGPLSQRLAAQFPGVTAYADTAALIAAFDYARYRHATVLLKGARRYQLERLIPYLTRHPGATYLKINLNTLRDNLRTIRRRLPASTRLMVMLKAAAYGSGSWQLAQELEREGVDYFAVAQPLEGIELRQRGIRTPILVQSPDPDTLALLPAHALEPAVWSWALLARWQDFCAEYPAARRLPLHLEFDTGMARLGFAPADAPALAEALAAAGLPLASVFTHLAASEDPAADAFTHAQLDAFDALLHPLRVHYPQLLAHAHNTGGILRHAAQRPYDLVRLGIGLYGVSPVAGQDFGLREIGSLHTRIAQIHRYPAGASISYGRTEILPRESRIATLPIGYADGLPRSLGNRRLAVLVRGQHAPIVGRICMDLLMVDVTEVPGAREGDEAVVFGAQDGAAQSVQVLADAVGTIAYEVLAGISGRVRRVYVKE